MRPCCPSRSTSFQKLRSMHVYASGIAADTPLAPKNPFAWNQTTTYHQNNNKNKKKLIYRAPWGRNFRGTGGNGIRSDVYATVKRWTKTASFQSRFEGRHCWCWVIKVVNFSSRKCETCTSLFYGFLVVMFCCFFRFRLVSRTVKVPRLLCDHFKWVCGHCLTEIITNYGVIAAEYCRWLVFASTCVFVLHQCNCWIWNLN